MKYYFTKNEAAKKLHRCENWMLSALKLGKIKGEKVSGVWLIPKKEVKRIKKNPFRISTREMYPKKFE